MNIDKYNNIKEILVRQENANNKDKNYNKIEYCLGSCLELLSAWLVIAVCQD